MMPARSHGQRRQFFDILQDIITHDRMFLDRFELFIGEFPVFIDDGLRNADFADIMKQAQRVDILLLFRAHSHPPGDLSGILCYADGVTAGIMIFCVDGFGKGHHKVLCEVSRLLLLLNDMVDICIHVVHHFLQAVIQPLNFVSRMDIEIRIIPFAVGIPLLCKILIHVIRHLVDGKYDILHNEAVEEISDRDTDTQHHERKAHVVLPVVENIGQTESCSFRAGREQIRTEQDGNI